MRACALAWSYPGLSRGDMRGVLMSFFFLQSEFNMIIKGKYCMSGQQNMSSLSWRNVFSGPRWHHQGTGEMYVPS